MLISRPAGPYSSPSLSSYWYFAFQAYRYTGTLTSSCFRGASPHFTFQLRFSNFQRCAQKPGARSPSPERPAPPPGRTHAPIRICRKGAEDKAALHLCAQSFREVSE